MSKKAELIGMDIAYEMVYSGDTIQDSNGRKYVVTEHGTCRDASGRETLFRDIQGPRLCAAEKKLYSPSQEAAAAVADQAAAAPRPNAFPTTMTVEMSQGYDQVTLILLNNEPKAYWSDAGHLDMLEGIH